jgi:hypothetical protein
MDQPFTIPADINASKRRAPRVGFELLVRCKQGAARSTVMLKDMTRFGARIEGLANPFEGEAISLILPGEAPRLAFVMWTSGGAAGLEFGDPLPGDVFAAMIRDYAIGQVIPPVPPAPAHHARAA